MYFEGPEKKLEVVFEGSKSLLSLPESFWKELVALAGAQIIKSYESFDHKAYLLSESSLFVWADQLTLITCGQTTLIKTVPYLIKELGIDKIKGLFYERKNEYYPNRQASNFYDDVLKLSESVSGESLQFGRTDHHHICMFSSSKSYAVDPTDVTLEILMYGVKSPLALEMKKKSKFRNNERLSLDLQKHFEFDHWSDHWFEPEGYSLNLSHQSIYKTFHLTPQGDESFLSYETAGISVESIKSECEKIVKLFDPEGFDVMVFVPKNSDTSFESHTLTFNGFSKAHSSFADIKTGYRVDFLSYEENLKPQKPAKTLDIKAYFGG